MAKKKSIRDIRSQLERIINANMEETINRLNSGRGSDGDARDMQLMQRRVNAREAAARYIGNIYAQKSTKKSINKMLSYSEDDPNYRFNYGRAISRKFFTSTYRGASVG